MPALDQTYIRRQVADTDVIYERGREIYEYGSFICVEGRPEQGRFVYEVDGNYGDYTAELAIEQDRVHYECDCPYPGAGCKHVVAVMLDALDRIEDWREISQAREAEPQDDVLTPEEIRDKALEDRWNRAKKEPFAVTLGEMFKGDHLLETEQGRRYTVTLHDPLNGAGHCTCPDFNTNQLATCKHLIHLTEHIKKDRKKLAARVQKERFPFIDIYWSSTHGTPRLFCERPESEIADLKPALDNAFDAEGLFAGADLSEFLRVLSAVDGHKKVRVRDEVLRRVNERLLDKELEEASQGGFPSFSCIKTGLYPYQQEGVRFGLYRRGALIGDEMGLGKTLQAIALGLLKREVFGFRRILVVTLASLKEQWKREVERFTEERAVVVAGSPKERQRIYDEDPALFKITNYEAVLRDVTILSRFKPDLIILDEAQRIKNFATKTADAVKSLPRKHALVLTGTPLENRLEDVYSIVQFLDPHMLAPLWRFAADHFMLSRQKKDRIVGYRNLDLLHEKLKSIVIRRRKADVLSELPDEITNNYYLDLSHEQGKIHGGYMQSLLPLLNKKFLTPMDIRRIQELLMQMRRVCDSTYLIDRKTHISPKLKELESILDELVVQSGRKLVIFSEWTTMTYLIARQLSRMSISFVELTGKIPVKKRQRLIDEFTHNPRCKVFLSTDSGGTGLNLQAADCVINFELPWNPARLNQRIGRVSRIGQTSGSINVINLIAKDSIEEKILAGIHLKSELFAGVFDGSVDMVEFSREKRNQMLNQLRAMMGEEMSQELPDAEPRLSEDIPEDTPHFLNPKALAEEEEAPEGGAEAAGVEETQEPAAEGRQAARESRGPGESRGNFLEGQSPEKVEAVLNSGLEFMSGLLEMATGQKLSRTEEDKPMLKLDPETGEVTMKFKLPGF